MVDEITYTFGPFGPCDTERFHRSYYEKCGTLKYFFPPHVKYIANFVNKDDVYFEPNTKVSVTVPVHDNLLNGNFKFVYEKRFGSGGYNVEVQGTFQNSKLNGNYSIKISSVDDNNGGKNRNDDMIITATFVDDLAQGPVCRKNNYYIDTCEYDKGKIIGIECRYQWLSDAKRDLNITLPVIKHSDPLSSGSLIIGYLLILDTITEHDNNVNFVFTIDDRGKKIPKYRVDFVPLQPNNSCQDGDDYYLRQVTSYVSDQQYLLSEWLINSVTQEVMTKHSYWSPSSCYEYKFDDTKGPGSYSGIYQKFGPDSNFNFNKTLCLIPSAGEHYRSFWFGNTYYDITYDVKGNFQLVMIDDHDVRNNKTMSMEFDYDGNLL